MVTKNIKKLGLFLVTKHPNEKKLSNGNDGALRISKNIGKGLNGGSGKGESKSQRVGSVRQGCNWDLLQPKEDLQQNGMIELDKGERVREKKSGETAWAKQEQESRGFTNEGEESSWHIY